MASTVSEVRWCDDCKSNHLNAPCGLTYAQRLRSITVDKAWMPAKTLKNYYDKDSIDDLFGNSEQERVEQTMEETQGLGTYTNEERIRFPGVEAAYLEGPEEELG